MWKAIMKKLFLLQNLISLAETSMDDTRKKGWDSLLYKMLGYFYFF